MFDSERRRRRTTSRMPLMFLSWPSVRRCTLNDEEREVSSSECFPALRMTILLYIVEAETIPIAFLKN